MNAISGDMRGLRRASMAGHVTLEDSDGHRWPPKRNDGAWTGVDAPRRGFFGLPERREGARRNFRRIGRQTYLWPLKCAGRLYFHVEQPQSNRPRSRHYTDYMTKKTGKKRQRSGSNGSWEDALRSFFSSERVWFLTGLIVCFVVMYLGIAMTSFLFTGGADQSVVESMPLSELPADHARVENWAGVRGAYVAETVMNRWFGVPSFFMLFFLGSAGLWLMRVCRMSLLKRFLLCSSMMIWSSVFLSLAFASTVGTSFLYPGGRHGWYLAEMLTRNLGTPGTVLLLLITAILIAVFTSSLVIPFMQRQLVGGWSLIGEKWQRSREARRARHEAEAEEKVKRETTPSEPAPTIYNKEADTKPAAAPRREGPSVEDEGYALGEDDEDEIAATPIASNGRREAEAVEAPTIFTVEVPREEEPATPAEVVAELGEYDPRLDLSNYHFPSLDLLKKYDRNDKPIDMEEQSENQKRIKQTLENFGISISSIKATVGPTITLYEVVPAQGVRISKIRNLEDDIALNLSALGIRIIAPMPGKGTIGIEVPNKDPQIVSMQSVISSRKFIESKYDLPVALGRTITNEVFMFDLCKAPHLLMAGATGQGKSVGLNTIITSLLYKKHPAELKLVLVDPKMVEFSIYAEIERHYLAKLPDEEKPIITDFTKVVHTLNSLCKEMDNRYELLTRAHVRNIKDYNEKFINRRLSPDKGHEYMPYIVVIIDEFGDLIMTAGREIEMPIARIAQKARAVGIHMVIATQRPSTNIITGTIKANFPVRVAFRVSSMIDSRTILDSPGANQLIGRGDLLFSQGSDMTRVQCAFVDTPEVEAISEFIGTQPGYPKAHELPEYDPEGEDDGKSVASDLSDRDPLFDEAARLVVSQQQGSTSLIQRKFSIGYNRAGRLMDQLQGAGIVGPYEGSKARQVLIQDIYSLEQKLNTIK